MKEYARTLEYLFSLEKFGIVFGLENIEWILGLLGDPHKNIQAVHIAGTNGKGSVAAMLSRMLEETGFRVGKYTSPHLLSFTERITINEEPIKEEDVAALTDEIRGRIAHFDEKRFFTFFDFTTALAFKYFFEKGVDISVIETGLGGRLDSTNVVQPLVSVITNVDYDHMEYLGDDISQIAREKAGIIKEGVPVVTGAEGIALQEIEKAAREKKSPLRVSGRDFSFLKEKDQFMSYVGIEKRMDNVFVNLRGDHQLANGALALCAAECLASSGFSLSEASMRGGMSRVEWPGRLETLRENPLILVDGAHNLHGVKALREYMGSRYGGKRMILIFGVMRDKSYEAMLEEIRPLADSVILTKPDMERALSPHVLEKLAPGAIITENLKDALKEARALARDEDVILITGSIFTVGEAKAVIDEIF